MKAFEAVLPVAQLPPLKCRRHIRIFQSSTGLTKNVAEKVHHGFPGRTLES